MATKRSKPKQRRKSQRRKLKEAHPSTNPYDSKPIKNPLAGRDARTVTGNKFAGGSHGTHDNPKSKVSFPTSRIGLVYRSLSDGVNLIENSIRLEKMISRELTRNENGQRKNFFHRDDIPDEEQLEDPPEEINLDS